jgi:hypothetical protein
MTAGPPGWGHPDEQPAPGPPPPEPGWSAAQPPAPGWSPAQPPPPSGGQPAWTGPQQGWSGWVAHRPPEVKPGVVPLRPLGVGEILDGAISTMRRHWKVQLGLSAAVVTVVSILQFTALYFVFRTGSGISTDGFGTDPNAQLDVATNVAQVVSAVVGMLAQVVVQGILTVVVSRAVLGQDVTMAEAWARARPRLGRLVLMSVAVLLLMGVLLGAPIAVGIAVGAAAGTTAGLIVGGLGLLAAIPLAVWVYVSLGVAAPAMMLEETGIRESFRRSRRLVRGSWWRVFGVLLLGMVIAQVLGGIIQVPFALASVFTSLSDGRPPGFLFYVLNVVGSSLAGTITYPFVAGVVALLYVDLRIRREGLDLALARAAGVRHPSTVAYPQYPGYPPPPPTGPPTGPPTWYDNGRA